MPVCVAPANGYLKIVPVAVEQCQAYVLVTQSEYSDWMTTLELSPSTISSAFGFGLSAVLITGYLSSYGVGLAKKLIRLI